MSRERISTMAANGGPPDAAGALYPGTVMHARLKPFGHRFSYRVFSLLVDLDRLDDLDRASKLLSVNKRNLCSFLETDHVEDSSEGIRAYADRLLRKAGIQHAARIVLLCYPRIFGYVFNPISVYFAYDDAGALIAAIYAVRNTFGERHTYVAPVADDELGPSGLHQSRAKIFHVSPFIGMDARYNFRVLPPGEAVRLRIHETQDGEPLLAATFSGERRDLTTANLGGLLVRFPLLTFKIMAAIHWEALKLWLKGARFHKSPPVPAKTASYVDARPVATPAE